MMTAMAVTNLQVLDIIEVMEAFLERKRPPVWNDASRMQHSDVAKTTFIKAKNHWKVFWLRADLKWYAYDPKPTVKTLKDFVKLVEEDKHGCFWG
jgi:hypothetical protein